jgi:TolB protein
MRYLLILFLSLNYLFSIDATLTIEKDVPNKATIALVEDSTTANSSRFHKKMFQLLKDDIKLSGHFQLNPKYHNIEFESLQIPEDLSNTEYILKYNFSPSATKLNIKLIRTSDNSIVFQKNYMVNTASRFPFLAHNGISDMNSALGYDDISWIKRYLIFSKYTSPRKSEIWVADYTLTFASVIVRGGLNLFPKWANETQSAFYYTSYNNKIPTLYRVDMITGKRAKILESQGILICSDVSQDSKRLLLTMAPKGQPDIYEYNIDSKDLKQITTFSGIDVNGKYIGDESKIVFVSDRTGKPNIYLKSIGSSSVSKVAVYGNENNSCDAFREYIIYSAKDGNSINIYLGSIYSSYIRPLTDGGINRFPRFSTNGKIVLYIKQKGSKNSIGYLNLATKENRFYPMISGKIQSIDW